ncbi:MAG: hypothetical protein CVU09_17400 [Bacteroidetes bacterium HGW-Bacteroidetes-4]|jgi:hypothetical protein|nr:MAG: hypothetical protein CVU09_17400 [Bacteroidetes bacterium HGW-Bacteroidetes-4]
MRKIPYLVKSATVAEITDVSGVVASAIGEAALGDTHLNTRVQDLNQLNTDMLRGMAKGRTKELSAPLNTADSLRDNLFRALIHFLKALIYWNKPETAPAAELLMAEINKQGTGLSKLSQEKESAHIDALLQAFQSPALAQALVTTNLVSLNNDLSQAQQGYKNLYKESAALESQKGEIAAASAIRNHVHENLRKVIDYLNVMQEVDAATYNPLALHLAEVIEGLNEKIRARLSSGTAEPDEPAEPV